MAQNEHLDNTAESQAVTENTGTTTNNSQQRRLDWQNPTVLLALVIYGVVSTVFLSLPICAAPEANLAPPTVGVLIFFITLAPAFLNVLIFAAYRVSYQKKAGMQSTAQKVLAWRRYAFYLAILMSCITALSSSLLAEDIKRSAGEFAFGAFTLPLYVGSARLEMPSMVLWAAYAGSLITTISITLRRFITQNLVPHFYLASTFRLLKGLLAAFLLWLAVQAFPEALTIKDSPHLVLLISFAAGAAAEEFFGFVFQRICKALGMNDGSSLSLEAIQGIEPTLAAYLQDEGIDSIQMIATTDTKALADSIHMNRSTIEDWQKQARLLRSLASPELATRFHLLGIHDLQDLAMALGDGDDKMDVDQFAEVLAGVSTKKAPSNSKFYVVLLRVLNKQASLDEKT